MKLIICNGSPRGKNSNTRLLMDQFIQGMNADKQFEISVFYFASASQRKAAVASFQAADLVILAFPLYTDAMPGIVKEFIEMLEPFAGNTTNPRMGFLVQSGFPEPAHSRYVEKYLERLADRMKGGYLGTIVKGGVEGIQIMPPLMTRKLYRRFNKLGSRFSRTEEFDDRIISKLAPYENFSRQRMLIFRFMQKVGVSNFYWDSQLKKNNAFENRFEAPYGTPL